MPRLDRGGHSGERRTVLAQARGPGQPRHAAVGAATESPLKSSFRKKTFTDLWDHLDGNESSHRRDRMPVLTRSQPLAVMFSDDGSIPNNPRLPFLLYRGAIDLAGTPDPEQVIEKTFAKNGWVDIWRNGIYPYAH